jgi:hypothetical protein
MSTVGINSIALWKMALSVRKEAMENATQDYKSYVAEIRRKITKDPFLRAYIACAFRSSTDADNQPLDKNYSQDDIDLDALFEMVQDCFNFRVNNAADLKDLDLEKCGHEFWLARNRHAANFWSRGLGEAGKRLAEAAAKLGEMHLRIGDDKQIYQ